MDNEATKLQYERGTEWSIWDLHVHTPCSLRNNYGGDTEATWARFLDELESLPSDVRVLGINDYWFLDGYKRVVRARAEGRLKNIDAIFPIVELRIPQFGGTAGSLSRVNLHVIFDPDLAPIVIQQQFIDRLSGSFRLDPAVDSSTWEGAITRESLTDLGAALIKSAPESERHKYSSPIVEGFNNLSVTIEHVDSLLQSTYLRGRAMLAAGKVEWADIRWSDQSIATKRDIVNRVSFLFTAFEDPTRWPRQVAKLRADNVNHRLLDCSDAHHWTDASQNERIGNCQTWIHATPTFSGLVHALGEFEHRVFVGLEPPMRARVRMSPERFISEIRVSSDDPVVNTQFDYQLSLNPGFVAVVGNKGQGKSALLDSIALAGNSTRRTDFAFLTPKRFMATSNRRARDYWAEIVWANGDANRVRFGDDFDPSSRTSIEYLPQRFVERICNSDPLGTESSAFENELREVLFTHIPEVDRAGEVSFDDLLRRRNRVHQNAIDRLQAELIPCIENYVSMLEFGEAHRLPDVESLIESRKREVDLAEQDLGRAKQDLVKIDAESGPNSTLETLRGQVAATEEKVQVLLRERQIIEQEISESGQQMLTMESLQDQANSLARSALAINRQAAGLTAAVLSDLPHIPDLVRIEVNSALIDSWWSAVRSTKDARAERSRQLFDVIDSHRLALKQLEEQLAAEDGARELGRRKVAQLEERLASLLGSTDAPDSLAGLLDLRDRVKSLPGATAEALDEAIAMCEGIHSAILAGLSDVEALYEPASDFLATSNALAGAGLAFVAGMSLESTWKRVPDHLDGRRSPELIETLLALPDSVELQDWEGLEASLRDILGRLGRERGATATPRRDPANSVKASSSLASFLTDLLSLKWIGMRFGLVGDGLPLAQLSPGQRGLLLALFYLIVDRRVSPLVLDQPEENLDNETIATRLVPAIREAAGRRQTIVVTHNANLAVVGDADQVVSCEVVDQVFGVTGGCISDGISAEQVLNVLEGTRGAFDARREKYDAVQLR